MLANISSDEKLPTVGGEGPLALTSQADERVSDSEELTMQETSPATESENTELCVQTEENAEEESERPSAAKKAKVAESPGERQWFLNTCDVANATFFSDDTEDAAFKADEVLIEDNLKV